MTTSTASIDEDVSPEHTARTVTRSYYAKGSISGRVRITELHVYTRDRWKSPYIPDTAEGRRLINIILHHYAHFVEGAELAEHFLSTRTKLSELERATAIKGAFRTKRLYEADDLAALIGLTMTTRTVLGFTTIGALDCPLETREKIARFINNAIKREKRRATPKPSASERKALRRLAVTYAALPTDGWLSIKELGARLTGTKEFARVGVGSMRKVLHRLIEIDGGQLLRTEVRAEAGGKFEATLVARQQQDHQRASRKASPRPPPPAPPPPPWGSNAQTEPSTPAEYYRWFLRELSRFTPNTAAGLANWFYGPVAKQLRERCGFAHFEDDLMKMARARRDELVGRPTSSRPTEGNA